MRDHNYIRPCGTRVPIAQITNEELHDLLASELYVDDSDGMADPIGAVRERLLLEAFIREKGLRQC